MAHPASQEPLPDRLLQLGMGFWASKTVLSGVELGVFTALGRGPRTADELIRQLDLHPRSARDFLDTLVALQVLDRVGDLYQNTAESARFLDRGQPMYVGGLLEMANARLYAHWGSLTEALRTGKPQNESQPGHSAFDDIYKDPKRVRVFAEAMTGSSQRPARALAAKFPWTQYRTFLDVGCAQGCVPVQVALAHPHLAGAGFDLPPVGPIFDEYVAKFDLSDRLRFHAGDVFNEDPLPKADVLILGRMLHGVNLEQKKKLLAKTYAALPPGGALIVHEALIDDDRRQNAFGLLMSLNMLIETEGGFDFTGADCMSWMRETGFRETRVEQLVGPESMAIGIK
jgi:precorrin-6B methylase 2